jgi:SNF2 family DNA or RNA helicase
MILKSAINKFLERKRYDYRPMKKWSDNLLDDYIERFPPAPPMWRKLHKHQKVMFAIGITTRRFAFFADTGMGKTMLSIALTRYFKRAGVNRKVLVLVPRRVNKSEWRREIKKHSPKTKCLVLRGNSQQKLEELQSTNALIIIETYAGFVRMVCTKVKRKRKKGMQLKPHLPTLNKLKWCIDGLILDESHNVGNKKSLAFRICNILNKHINTMFALTGTPFGRDPIKIWSQLYLVDQGHTLGETLGLFRNAFFSTRLNRWGGFEHTFMKRKQKLLNRLIAHSSIRYKADQADLPTLVPIEKTVRLPMDARAYYNTAKQAIIGARGNYREMKNAFVRMRQISSGFIGYENDETGEKAKFEFPTNPKLEQLMAIIATIPQEHKIVVYHDFHWSGERIARELKEEEIGYVHLYGKTGKHADDYLERFDHDPKVRVLVLSNELATGLNLQVAKYGIFFESPVPVITRKQAQRRIERQETKHKRIFVYDLVTEGTVDRNILQFHREGKDLFEAIVEGKNVV